MVQSSSFLLLFGQHVNIFPNIPIVQKVLQTMQFQVRKIFFRGIVQFFGKKGAFEGNFRPKYVAILWCNVPHFYYCLVNI